MIFFTLNAWGCKIAMFPLSNCYVPFTLFYGTRFSVWDLLECLGFVKVLTYGAAIKELENAGEVNIKISMHNVEKVEGSSNLSIRSTKTVCFVLDPLKESKKKKAGFHSMCNKYTAYKNCFRCLKTLI